MKSKVYEINIELIEPMLGTVPKDPEIYKNYIASKKDSNGELLIPHEAMIDEEVATVPADAEKSGWTGFHRDNDGVFIYNYMILGFLKEAGNTLKTQIGIKNLKSKIDNLVFVEPRRIHLKKEVDGHLERPLRAMTMQGPRVTLVRSDYVSEGTKFTARIRVLDNKEITGDTIGEILEYGRLKGLGQFRNGSYGQFKFEMKELA